MESFAENELMYPMRLQPLHSPLHTSATDEGMATSTSVSTAAMSVAAKVKSGAGSEAGGRSRPVSIAIKDHSAAAAATINCVTTKPGRKNKQSHIEELIAIGMRH